MDNKELIEDLRRRGLGNGTSLGSHSGLYDAAADRIEALAAKLTELQAKYDRLNDVEQGQCAILLARLREKDKQLSLAEDLIHRVGPDALDAYRLFSGPQEDGAGDKVLTVEDAQ